MLYELFDRQHKNKYDFLYLPIDSTVKLSVFRILATLDMLSSTLHQPTIFQTFIKCLIIKDGKNLTATRFAN